MKFEDVTINIDDIGKEMLIDLANYYEIGEGADEVRLMFVSIIKDHYETLTKKRNWKTHRGSVRKMKTLERLKGLLASRKDDDWTVEELSEEMKLTTQTIREYLKVIGEEPKATEGRKQRWDKLREQRNEQILKLIDKGVWFVDDLAKEIGVVRSTMYKHLEELGREDIIKRSKAEFAIRRYQEKEKIQKTH